jgi:hypothetical protein
LVLHGVPHRTLRQSAVDEPYPSSAKPEWPLLVWRIPSRLPGLNRGFQSVCLDCRWNIGFRVKSAAADSVSTTNLMLAS